LVVLGLLLKVANRTSPRFRAQVTTDLVLEITAGGGCAHHYRFRAADRSVSSRTGRAAGPTDLSLNFESAALGFRTLSRPDAIGRLVRLAQAGRVRYTGNATYALWFWGLTRMVLPLGRQRPLREPLPGALCAPDPRSKVAGRITREPVAAELDPGWVGAHTARAGTAMLRGVNGEEIPLW